MPGPAHSLMHQQLNPVNYNTQIVTLLGTECNNFKPMLWLTGMCQKLFNVIFWSVIHVHFDIWNKQRKKNFFLKILKNLQDNFQSIWGGTWKKKFWWKFFFSDFIPYIKMDKNSLLESHIKKFLSYLSKPQYWFKIVTLI